MRPLNVILAHVFSFSQQTLRSLVSDQPQFSSSNSYGVAVKKRQYVFFETNNSTETGLESYSFASLNYLLIFCS